MARIERHSTPGRMRDAPDPSKFYDEWHKFIDSQLGTETRGSGGEFYDAHDIDVKAVGVRSLAWMAFPRDVLTRNREDRVAAFQEADDRDVEQVDSQQDEYCEWRVTRRSDGRITKVTFVTETPEYWQELWRMDRSAVVKLYRTLVDPSVVEEDLKDKIGNYDPFNKWNTTHGIVHLIQGINRLDAAIDISKSAADSGGALDNYEMGSLPVQSADARVARDIGTLVRKGLSVTLLDPVGLYISGWDDTGWEKPDGTPVGNYWNVVREDFDPVLKIRRVLRVEYEVPNTEGFVVGEIRIGGRPIDWGGQIAEHISVTAVGLAGTRAPTETS